MAEGDNDWGMRQWGQMCVYFLIWWSIYSMVLLTSESKELIGGGGGANQERELAAGENETGWMFFFSPIHRALPHCSLWSFAISPTAMSLLKNDWCSNALHKGLKEMIWMESSFDHIGGQGADFKTSFWIVLEITGGLHKINKWMNKWIWCVSQWTEIETLLCAKTRYVFLQIADLHTLF